ncbi:alpha/beta fold hydrolase [Micromonospora sp. WMMD1155]|uniref:alpha/beta fold hydrolase n=1 Tax=Micromonospora sp. WMMD1155 TaxID=3016094 RepID=UPI00249C6341|nr:alpha/beta fold hydrolase [Micromonospora sp. WMMD1155]WFE50742.1 alpha/beta fold hydrolase [Micromonospora sp. WMMD1155]
MGGDRVPAGFTEQRARVGQITMNYVRGGSGPPLVLLHGYPQCWYMWRHLMPELGRSFDVVAPDLRDPAHLRASFAYFRTFDRDIADNATYRNTKLTMPVLAVGAAASLGGQVAEQVRRYADAVLGEVIEDCGHWLYEERPDEMLALLRDFLGAT